MKKIEFGLIVGHPIFSIDIHPDDSHLVTGGQGMYKFSVLKGTEINLFIFMYFQLFF